MLRALIFSACIISTVSAQAACPVDNLPRGESSQTIHRPEGVRNFNLYVPKSYNTTGPVPLVVHWHGFSDSCNAFGGHCKDAHCDFFEESEARGFIFAAMCGWGEPSSFNAGTCCPPANTFALDDVALARELVGNLSAKLCIDPARVYTTGFSNGAMMSQILACKAWDLFAAAGSVAGVVELAPGNEEGLALCNASYAPSPKTTRVLDVHGTADPTVPMGGDALLGFPPVPENMGKWAARNGCVGDPITTYKSPDGTFYNLVWQNCANKGTVERIVHPLVHEWPQVAGQFDSTK